MISGQSSATVNGQCIRSTDLVAIRTVRFFFMKLDLLSSLYYGNGRTQVSALVNVDRQPGRRVQRSVLVNTVVFIGSVSQLEPVGAQCAMRIQSGPPPGIFLWCSHSMVSLEPVLVVM